MAQPFLFSYKLAISWATDVLFFLTDSVFTGTVACRIDGCESKSSFKANINVIKYIKEEFNDVESKF